MLNRLRQRSRDEGGFTLIELLVVILIIGILAAIAIPSFIGQKSKANDASAKTQARSLQTAMETAATDANGSYAGVTLERLQQIEPTLKDESTNEPKVDKAEAEEWEVQSKNVTTGNVYKIARDKNGVLTRSCTEKGKGGCPTNEKW
jgi:type IV pilus assembly protein PilA